MSRIASAVTAGTLVVATAFAPAAPAFAASCLTATAVVPAVPWAQQRLQAGLVWPVTRGEGVTVAVLDTGVDPTLPALAGRVGDGGDLLGPGRADNDCLAHGTFVASLIAAAPVAGTGQAGIAPGAGILAVRVTTDAGTRTGGDAWASGVARAVQRGAKVIVVAPPVLRSGPALVAAVASARAGDAVLIVAAGAGQNGDPPVDNATLAGVISVGAIDANGTPDTGTADPVDLFAPGTAVTGTVPGGGQLSAGGAGYATGFVAGAAALIRARDPGLSAAEVKARLLATATRLAGSRTAGELDVVSAVTAVADPTTVDGRRPAPVPVQLARSANPDRRPAALALAVLGTSLALLLAGIAVATARSRARRRES